MDSSELSASQAALLAHCQRISFGSIRMLKVEDGQPVLDPLPRCVREIRLGEAIRPAPQRPATFTLKAQHSQLLSAIGCVVNGVIEQIEVKDGLPFRIWLDDMN